MPALRRAEVVAGEGGLDRVVEHVNVMEVPDILPWVKPHELLLTTAYPLREAPGGLVDLVAALDAHRLAGIAVKLGRYLDALPDGMLRRADDLGFPVLLLPDDVGFNDILTPVLTDVLHRQGARLARSETIHRTFLDIVLGGGELGEIATQLDALLHAPVAIVEPDGRVLAESSVDRVAAQLRRAGVIDRDGAFQVHGAAGIVVADGVRYAAARISAGARDHGRIIAVEAERRLVEEDVVALESAATVAALLINKALAVSAVEAKFQSDFFHDLVNDRVESPAQATARAASLGWDLARRLTVIVAEPDEATGTAEPTYRMPQRLADELGTAVRTRDPGAAVVALSGELVIITGLPDAKTRPDDARKLACSITTDLVSERSVSYGVSRPADGVAQIAQAYAQARSAAHIGRQIQGLQQVVHFDDLGAFRLISLVDNRDEMRAFARETLGELAEPSAEAADLHQTLRVLLECNLNVAEAARRLHFHYNTLRYRIEKLEGIVGPFCTDPQVRFNLLLALQVTRFRTLWP